MINQNKEYKAANKALSRESQLVSRQKWKTGDNFMATQARTLKPLSQSIWFMLWMRSNKWDGKVKITVGLLAQFTGMSEKSVKRSLKELRDAGVVKQLVVGHRCGDSIVPSIYKVLPPDMPEAEQMEAEKPDDLDDFDFPF